MTSHRDTTGLPFEQPSRELLGRGFDDLAISDVEDATSDARNPSVMGDNDYGLLEISVQPLEQIQDFLAGLRVEPSFAQVVQVGAVHLDSSRGRAVDSPKDIQERRLAAPRRPSNRDEFAVGDTQIEAAQCDYFRFPRSIDLDQVLSQDFWHVYPP